jgi:hypothetical protein
MARIMIALLGAALWGSPAAAQSGFRAIAGGSQHVGTKLICPAEAGNFHLTITQDEPEQPMVSFRCDYVYRCDAADCADAQAQASLIAAPMLAVQRPWRDAATRDGYLYFAASAPNWGTRFAPTTLHKSGDGKGQVAALWSLGGAGTMLVVSGRYRSTSAASMEALVRRARALNPIKEEARGGLSTAP